MFQELSMWQMVLKGGLTMVVLVACSILSWTVILERLWRFWKATRSSDRLPARVAKLVRAGKAHEAMELAQTEEGVVAEVIQAGLQQAGRDRSTMLETMERSAAEKVMDLETRLGILGTLGSVSPYIGLFGTVLGIINAFHALSQAKEAGAAVVSAGIAEALVATAAGLFVAVPSMIAYNAFVKKLASLDTRMALAASELAEAASDKGRGAKEDRDVEA